MSRSYRRKPCLKAGGPNHRRFAKNHANRKIRRTADIPNGKAYRRVTNPWDIHEYIGGQTFKEWVGDIESQYKQYMNGGTYYYNWHRGKRIDQDTPPDIMEELNKYRMVYHWK